MIIVWTCSGVNEIRHEIQMLMDNKCGDKNSQLIISIIQCIYLHVPYMPKKIQNQFQFQIILTYSYGYYQILMFLCLQLQSCSLAGFEFVDKLFYQDRFSSNQLKLKLMYKLLRRIKVYLTVFVYKLYMYKDRLTHRLCNSCKLRNQDCQDQT